MKGVLFIVMPFGAFDAPQAGISTIQAQLKVQGIPCDIAYLNLAFAQGIGVNRYASVGLTSGELFAGEWLFAMTLFSDQEIDYRGYVNEILIGSRVLPQPIVQQITALVPLVEPYLDYCMRTIKWDRYSIVGFTSMFEQNLASLSLARRIKDRYPDKIIAMGGANCFGPMGVQLHRSFQFLDYVFTGEADLSFPALVSRLARCQSTGDEIKGYVRREGSSSVESGPALCLEELDRLPYPAYDDFYQQYASYRLPRSLLQYVLLETGRGCWWGQKNQCKFCGINHNEIPFRTKSPERALDEMQHLANRYAIRHLMTVDNILDPQYFKTLLPELSRRRRSFSLFYESKANLLKDQVKLLAKAGVVSIQPGIESFSQNVLKLMHKGVSPLQNAMLLKWCCQYGITPLWNLLYGFPGENTQDYQNNLEFIQALTHLEPPMGFGQVRLERFSPMFEHPEQFGVRHIKAYRPYRYLYPFEEPVLQNIAYFFDFDYDGKEKIEGWCAPLIQELERWKLWKPPRHLDVVHRSQDLLVVRDTRPTRIYPDYCFSGREKTIIEFCDYAQPFSRILQHLRSSSSDTAFKAVPADEVWLKRFLDYLIAHRLMVHSGDRYMCVILPHPVTKGGNGGFSDVPHEAEYARQTLRTWPLVDMQKSF